MSSFSNIMGQVHDPDAARATIVPKPKPATKKVKVANSGNEIKKMTARANPPKKTAVHTSSASKLAPRDAPKPTPQSPPKKRKADRVASSTVASEPAAKSRAKKKPKTTATMKDITAPSPRPYARPVAKKKVVEEKDELDISPKERDISAPKAKMSAGDDQRYSAALSQGNTIGKETPKREPTASRPTTPPITAPPLKPTSLTECLPVQHWKDDALEHLEDRRTSVIIALEGLIPLMKKGEAIETAVAVLEQQVEDYDQSIEKLVLFGRGFETGKIKGTDAQTLIALASWGLEVQKEFKGKNIYIDAYDEREIAEELGASVKEEAGGEDQRFSQKTLDEVFGAEEDEEKPSAPNTDSEDVEDYDLFEPELTPSPITPTARLARPRSRPSSNSSLFLKPRKASNAPISRAVAPMGVVDPTRATRTNLIDAEEAMMAEAIDMVGRKSRR